MHNAGLTAWIDASGGISGDMLLGACLDAGAPSSVINQAIAALGLPELITVESMEVRRHGVRATHAVVTHESSPRERHLSEIVALLERADLPGQVGGRAIDAFRRLAEAESRAHGVPPEEVHFHEVGALDSIADVVGTLVAFDYLGIDRVVCGAISLGAGSIQTQHGVLTVPGPAVLELLTASGAPAQGGPIDRELATPTGVALALTLAESFGPLPPLVISTIGVGAGTADPHDHVNVCRLVLGAPTSETADREVMTMIETNIDDLDPRLWPPTLARLINAGAADAWLTHIVMKKGRPAHTLHVLAHRDSIEALVDLVFADTSSIGLRVFDVVRVALHRDYTTVAIEGHTVSIKRAWHRGKIVNAEPEFDDVLRASTALGWAPREVLRRAQALAGSEADQTIPHD